MRRLAFITLVLCVSAALPASAAQSRASVRGHRLAVTRCSTCHAVERTGASPNPKSPSFRDLSSIYEEHSLQEKLTDIEESGHYDMPPMRLHSNEISDLVAYLNRLRRTSPRRP